MGHHHHGGGALLYGIRKARREEGRALARLATRNHRWQQPAPQPPKQPGRSLISDWLIGMLVIIPFSCVIVVIGHYVGQAYNSAVRSGYPPCVTVYGSPATIKYDHDRMFMEYEVPVLDGGYGGTAKCHEYKGMQGDVPYSVITKWKLDTAKIMQDKY